MKIDHDFPKLQNRVAEATARRLQRDPVPSAAFSVFAAALDALLVAIPMWFALFAVFTAGEAGTRFSAVGAAVDSAVVAAFTVLFLCASWGYRLSALRSFAFGTAHALCAAVGTLLLCQAAGAVPQGTGFLTTMAGVFAVSLGLGRAFSSAVTVYAQQFGLTARNAVILGGGPHAEAVIEAIDRAPGREINIFGMFDDRADDRSPASVLGIPKLGRIADIVLFARQTKVDMIIVAFPESAKRRIAQITEILRELPVDIHLLGLSGTLSSQESATKLDPDQIGQRISRRPFTRNEAFAKRLFDIVVAGTALVILSPVLVLIAIAIKLDSRGPVFFYQQRSGFNGSIIGMFKFRSMYHADADLTAQRVVTRDDPRVTRIGRFLRRTSLDEVPQLLNVLRGDISLVGPRPHAVGAVYSETTPFEELVESYALRHRVQPGITGWAQINGWRGEIDSPDRLVGRIESDLYYIENRSMWLDVCILARTVPALLNTKYAY